MIWSSAAQYYVLKKANLRFSTLSQGAQNHVIVWSAKDIKPWFCMYLRTKRPRIPVSCRTLFFLLASSFPFMKRLDVRRFHSTQHDHPQRPPELPLPSGRHECSPSTSPLVFLSVVDMELRIHVSEKKCGKLTIHTKTEKQQNKKHFAGYTV